MALTLIDVKHFLPLLIACGIGHCQEVGTVLRWYPGSVLKLQTAMEDLPRVCVQELRERVATWSTVVGDDLKKRGREGGLLYRATIKTHEVWLQGY